MELGIGLGLLISAAIYFMLNRKNKSLEEHEKKDIALEHEQEVHEKELDSLEDRLKKIEEKLLNKNPKEVEEYWDNEDNN